MGTGNGAYEAFVYNKHISVFVAFENHMSRDSTRR